MNWKNVHKVWALDWCPRKVLSGAQTLCMAILLLAFASSDAHADCPAAPIADPDDMVVSFLALNGTQAAPGTLMPSTVKEGMLVYDDTADKLKICDGTNWIDVGSGSGTDTLASLSCASGEIAKYNGTAWACAADGGGSPGGNILGASTSRSINTVYQAATDIWVVASCTLSSGGNANGGVLAKVGATSTPATVISSDSSTFISGSAWVPYSGLSFPVKQGQYWKIEPWSTSPSCAIAEYPLTGGGADTLASLSCVNGEIAKFNGTAWECAEDGGGSGGSTGPYLRLTYSGSLGRPNVVPYAVAESGGGATWASNKFTAVTPGVYVLTANARSATGIYYLTLSIRKNGSSLVDGYGALVTNGKPGTTNPSIVTYLNAGDYIDFYFNHDDPAGTMVSGSASIAYLGAGATGGGGSDTLADLSCNVDEIPKWNGSVWACAADGGGGSGTLVSGTGAAGTSAAAVTNSGWQNFPGAPTLTLPSAGTYFVTSQAYYQYSSGCGDVLMNWSGSNILYKSTDGKWQACGVSGTSQWMTYSHVITVSDATTLNAQYTWTNAGTAGTVTFGGSKYLKLNTGSGGGSSQWADVTGGINYAGGNVGIGTTSPAATAVLDLTSTAKGFLPPRMTGTQRDAIASPAEGLVVYNTTTKSLDLRVASSWLSFGGSMTGNTMVPGWPDAIKCNVTNPNFGATILHAQVMPYAVDGDYWYWTDIAGTSYRIKYNANGSFDSYQGGISATSDCNTTIAALYAADQAFNFVGGGTTSADGSTGQVQFNEGGNLKADVSLHWDNTNKRLGVGTASPDQSLHVFGGTTYRGLTSSLLLDNSIPGLMFEDSQTSEAAAITSDAGELRFYTRNASGNFAAGDLRMTIQNTGNVGIGTTSPGAKLDIFDQSNSVGYVNLGYFRESNNATGTNYSRLLIGQNATNVMFLEAADQSNVKGNMLLQPWGGNVGIGTTSPTSKLSVSGGNVEIFASAAPGLVLTPSSGSSYVFGANTAITGAGIYDSTGGTWRLVVQNTTGNVGIGTTSPGQLLHVSKTTGDTYVRVNTDSATHAAGIQLTAGAIGNYGSIVVHRASDKGLLVLNSENGPLILGVNEAETMRISSTGNVGIGTSNPQAKLHVSGGASGVTTGGLRIEDNAGNYRTLYMTSNNATLGFYSGANVAFLSNAGVWTNASDIAIKKNITPISYGLDTVMKLRPVHYNMKSDDKAQVGFIAQEMMKVVPEVVEGTDGTLSLSYGNLVAVLTKAVQELKADNDNLHTALKAANDNHAAAIEDLRREIDALKAARQVRLKDAKVIAAIRDRAALERGQ